MQIFFLILFLPVYKAIDELECDGPSADTNPLCTDLTRRLKEASEKCDVPHVATNALCTYLTNHVNQTTGRLVEFTCGCIAGVLLNNVNYCGRSADNFIDAPACGRLVESDTYLKLINSNSVRNLALVCLLDIGKVCMYTEIDAQKILEIVFNSGFISIILRTSLFTKSLSGPSAEISACYDTIRKLLRPLEHN